MSAACAGGMVTSLRIATRLRQQQHDDLHRPPSPAYRKMEEGHPPQVGVSDATWNLVNTVIMCFSTVIGIAMLAYLLVSRFVYHDPDMQDPSEMLLLVALSLCVMGAGYLPTLAKYYCEEMENNDDKDSGHY